MTKPKVLDVGRNAGRRMHPNLLKERRKAYDRRRYLANRDAIIARNKAYDAANPEQARRRWNRQQRRRR